MSGLTETVARFIAESSFADIPGAATDKAKKVITDTIGVILAGAGSELAPPLMAYLQRSGEAGGQPILGTGRTTSAELAAMINGSFGHALDFDDVLSMMPAHPSAVILPALFADLDGADGRRLLEAYIIGIEVGAKIGLGIRIGHYHRGFHGTGTLGIFSALAALAKLHRLDVPTTRQAFGIAASMSSGLQRNFGTMVKPLHTGWAARSALAAVRLAQCGYSAAQDVLEAKAGFFAAYGTEQSDPQLTADTLGRPWTMLDPGIALKKFACCYASHRPIDGITQLRAQLGFDAGSIEKVVCRMPPGARRALIYSKPVTGLQAKFSLDYPLAAGVLDGKFSLRTFTDAAVLRPEIQALYAKLELIDDPRLIDQNPQFESLSPGSRGFVEVEAMTKNGNGAKTRIDHAPGSPARELSWDEVSAKFLDCAAQTSIPRAGSERALGALRKLEHCNAVADVIALLR
jgi:2-methylcitrate dehydratase PrpD